MAINVATVLVCIGIGGFILREAYPPQASKAIGGRGSQGHEIAGGQQLPRLAGYDWRSHKRTLVLALRDGCHYCEESAPFYRSMAALERDGRFGDIHILAVFPDHPAVVNKVPESEQLNVEAIPSIDLAALGVIATPTALLVDQAGMVLSVRVGELNESQQQVFLDALRPSPRNKGAVQ
jgi:hypothetical protein